MLQSTLLISFFFCILGHFQKFQIFPLVFYIPLNLKSGLNLSFSKTFHFFKGDGIFWTFINFLGGSDDIQQSNWGWGRVHNTSHITRKILPLTPTLFNPPLYFTDHWWMDFWGATTDWTLVEWSDCEVPNLKSCYRSQNVVTLLCIYIRS